MPTHSQVASDPTIFRPDGFIVIPRSDGDPTYTAPNTTPPDPNQDPVNYYHVFQRSEDRHVHWRSSIGDSLAQSFGLPKLSSEQKNWQLHDFPRDYHFAEQRKGPRHAPRTDPYLFACKGRRFRSTKEVLPHLEWLLLDPTLNPANCECKYCGGGAGASGSGRKAATPTSTPLRAKRPTVPRKPATPQTASAVANAASRGKKPAPGKPSAAQANAIIIHGVEERRPVPGVSIDSVPRRDAEIMRDVKPGQCEGFRIGEVVWCRLDHPVVDPSHPTRRITQWPVLIEDPSLMVQVAPASNEAGASAPNTDGDFSLAGRVTQQRAYHVRFLGTATSTKARETQLSPFLSGFISDGLLESNLGTIEQHTWLQTADELPLLKLADPAEGERDYDKAIIAFAFAMQSAAILRSTYVVTDVYSTAATGAGVLSDLAAGGVPGAAAAANSFADGAFPATPTRPGAIAGAGAGVCASAPGTPASPAAPTAPTVMYQGLYYGVERIWVGEVVRLKLSMADLRKLQRELNAALVRDLPPGAQDPPAIYLDFEASYVMRLSAIYKETYGNKKVVRIAGEVFQIVTVARYNTAKKEEAEELERRQQAAAAGGGEGSDANAQSNEAGGSGEASPAAQQPQQQSETKPQRLKLPEPSILRAKPGYPAMPPLPAGFVLMPLADKMVAAVAGAGAGAGGSANADAGADAGGSAMVTVVAREVSMPAELIAGRLYPSYGVPADGPRVENEIKQGPKDTKTAGEEDTQDELRARLSVAGLLSGCVKPMRTRTETVSRSSALKAAFEMARGDIARLITEADGLSEDELDEASQPIARLGEGEAVEEGQAADITMSAERIAQTVARHGGNGAEAQEHGPSGAPDQDAASTGKRAADESQAATQDTAKKHKTDTTNEPTPSEEQALPEGWVTRKSRSSGATYYVYLPTKVTQWERPT
ncbi:hypothetical protein ACQY0O_008452 [Thecaphora frezii]